jgi:hypothetical protein
MTEPAFTVARARYAKGMMAVSCPSNDGWKTRAARLAEHLKGRWTGREKAYILSPRKAQRLQELFDAGRDASAITGELYPVQRKVDKAPGSAGE